MKVHNKKKAESAIKKIHSKPEMMLGNLRKNNVEFAADLCIIAHQSKQIKRRKTITCVNDSPSLLQKRESTRRKDKLQKKAQVIHEAQDEMSQSLSSDNDSADQYNYNDLLERNRKAQRMMLKKKLAKDSDDSEEK